MFVSYPWRCVFAYLQLDLEGKGVRLSLETQQIHQDHISQGNLPHHHLAFKNQIMTIAKFVTSCVNWRYIVR